MTIQDDVKVLGAEEFAAFKAWIVTTETDRRAAAPAVERAQAEVVAQLQEAGKLEKPAVATEVEPGKPLEDYDPWVDPGTDHALMYRQGDIVAHDGRLVESTHSGLNHWEPGTLGLDGRIWRDVTPEPDPAPDATEPPAPAAPDGTAAHPFAFAPGLALAVDQYVTDKGVTYKVIQAHTSAAHWPPDAVPAMFQKV